MRILTDEEMEKYLIEIQKASNTIHKKSMRGGAEYLIFRGKLAHQIYLKYKDMLSSRFQIVSLDKIINPSYIEVIQAGENIKFNVEEVRENLYDPMSHIKIDYVPTTQPDIVEKIIIGETI
jgi:hypothetical protein